MPDLQRTPDEQRLHDALHAVVPPPPAAPARAREARVLSGRLRRRRWATGAALVVVAALAVPTVRALVPDSHRPEVLAGVVPTGQGAPACHQLDRKGVGGVLDSDVLDVATASAWLRSIHSPLAGDLGAGPVTACVTYAHHFRDFSVVVLRHHRPAVVVAQGDYQVMRAAMLRLNDALLGVAPSVVDAPYRCPDAGADTNTALPGSGTLPTGATAVRVCWDGFYTPTQSLTSGVDEIVRAINARPLLYSRGSTCAGGLAQSYMLVFRYPHGTRTIAADSCGWFEAGPVQRQDASPSMGDQVLRRLATQEAEQGTTTPPPCPGHTDAPSGLGDLTHVVAARYCSAGSTGNGQALTQAQLQALTEWGGNAMAVGTTAVEGPCHRPANGWPHLALADAWHNAFTVTVKCTADPRYLVSTTPPGAHPLGHGGGLTSLVEGDFRRVLHHLIATNG